MKLIERKYYYIDANFNTFNKDKFTLKQAEKASKSLKNCKGCTCAKNAMDLFDIIEQ